MEGAGAPLYETLLASFPKGLMPEGLEANIQGKIRKRLRDIGYRVVFPPDEEWQIVVEYYAIAAMDRLHRSFSANPWFWTVSWASVLGAAAVDFWPEIATPAERRVVATDAAASHLEQLLINRALSKGGNLPEAVIKGLRAIGQSTLPGVPSITVDKDANFLLPDPYDDGEEDPTLAALAAMSPWNGPAYPAQKPKPKAAPKALKAKMASLEQANVEAKVERRDESWQPPPLPPGAEGSVVPPPPVQETAIPPAPPVDRQQVAAIPPPPPADATEPVSIVAPPVADVEQPAEVPPPPGD